MEEVAKFSLKLPQMDELEEMDEKQAIKKIHSYLYQLNEQLRYMMCNLDSENLSDGAVNEQALGVDIRNLIRNISLKEDGLEASINITAASLMTTFRDEMGDFSTLSQTATSLSQAVQDALGNYSTTTETATAITSYVTDALGNYSSTQETAQAIASYVTNALGDYSTTTETAAAISSYVTNALGDYSTTTETAAAISTFVANALGDYSTTTQMASAIAAYVTNNAYQLISGIAITAYGVDVTGSKYVQISSGGSFILDSNNLDINSTSGLIEANFNGDPFFRILAGRTQILGLDLYSTYDNTYTDVTDTITSLEHYGWIQNASVSGNTLTLTKWDGSIVNFSKAGTALDSLEIEAVTGNTSAFRANAYDSSQAVLDYADGEIYLDDVPGSYSRNTWACVRPTGGITIAYVPLSGYWDAAQAAVTPTTKQISQVVGRITGPEAYDSQAGIWAAKMRVTVTYTDLTYDAFNDVDLNTSYLHS